MNSLIRITSAVNKVSPADPITASQSIQRVLSDLMETKPDIIVFPSCSLCSSSTGSLLKNPCISDMCSNALDEITSLSGNMGGFIIIGTMVNLGDGPASVTAVISSGRIVGYIPHDNNIIFSDKRAVQIIPKNTIFESGELKYCIVPTSLEKLSEDINNSAKTGCDVVIATSCSPIIAGQLDKLESEICYLSENLGITIALSNGGVGDTSFPYMNCGITIIAEHGKILSSERSFQKEVSVTADVDCDIIRSTKKYKLNAPVEFSQPATSSKKGVMRKIVRNPYLPEDNNLINKYLLDLFTLQTQSLISRMVNIGISKLILGVSGGLDSTLAILVAANALKQLNLPAENLIGVTMPGFGTSDRTYYNALSLIDILGAKSMDISIKESVLQHFEDINHNVTIKDVTYENAQARERTQILFDLGNKNSALVVGTGDLSEAALGWCTFGGDHMAGYNVNIGITKTVIRSLVTFLAENDIVEGTKEILKDILDTPVSPELLPPDESGDISQKTENILGPYELHDFFLYYFIKYNLRPEKLFFYACVAFSPELSPAYIKEKLSLFIKRFFKGQFKRSCAPDSAVITEISLSGVNFQMPSDCSEKAFVSMVENINAE